MCSCVTLTPPRCVTGISQRKHACIQTRLKRVGEKRWRSFLWNGSGCKNALLGQTRSTSLLVLPILLLIRLGLCSAEGFHLWCVLDVFYWCSAAASKSKKCMCCTCKHALYMRYSQNNSLTISINKDNSANRCTTLSIQLNFANNTSDYYYLFVTLAPNV